MPDYEMYLAVIDPDARDDDDAEEDYEHEDRDPYERAKELGLVVRVPALNELFIDIDDEQSLAALKDTLDILNRETGAEDATYVLTPSPSGEPHHFRAVVTWPEPIESEFHRLGLQAILGSDRKREALCWLRAGTGRSSGHYFCSVGCGWAWAVRCLDSVK